jgi:sugar O-acyltransferase (sialic acid O-acetyltransferase NeuD family)
MTRPLLILGTGGSAYDLLDVVEAINEARPTWEPVGFLDDTRPVGARHLDLEILGSLRDAKRFVDCSFVNVIGSEKSFRGLPEILGSTGLAPERFATLVHPAASVSSRARLGHGVVVNPGVVIGGGVSIGNHVMLCPGCIVGHESSIGDYSILAPGAVISGLVEVEPICYVGAKAAVRQRLKIGRGSLIGLGAVVVRSLPPASCAVGNPAKPLEVPNERVTACALDRPD